MTEKFSQKTVAQFLDELASSAPVPGGGSGAALVGALGAALASMVGNLTLGKPKYADVQADIQALLAQTEALRARLTNLIEEDGRPIPGSGSRLGLKVGHHAIETIKLEMK